MDSALWRPQRGSPQFFSDLLGVRYLVGGSLASSIHGEPRSTNDIDVLADLAETDIASFIEAVRPAYYVSEQAIREAIRSETSFNVIHIGTALKVDVFLAGSDAFNRERLRLRQNVQVLPEANSTVFVDTAEHSILRKLEWYRRGGEVSDRQWRDVVAVLRIQASALDAARLDTWAEQLGVSDLLRKARDQAA